MSEDILQGFNKVFQVKARLGIMTVLLSEGATDFSTLKTFLDLTDGNLASHLKVLEEKGYLEVEKEFVDRKPRTIYRSTADGKKEFRKHLKQMKDVINRVL
ncbi:MAG: winged helix-turn-helix domain-containing protein [Halanaerobiales bacterium]